MSINDLMHRIWLENVTTDGVKPEAQLSESEWQLILSEWPELYGNYGNIKKTRETVENLRSEWKNKGHFFLFGHTIRVSIKET